MPPKQYHSRRLIYCAVIGCPEFGKSQRADNFKKRHCLGTNLNCPIHQEFYPEYYDKPGTNVADDYHLVILESVQNAIPQEQHEPDLIDEMLAVNEDIFINKEPNELERMILASITPSIPVSNYDTIDISLFSMGVSYHGSFYRFGFVFLGSIWYLSSLPFQVFMQQGHFSLVTAFYTLDADTVHSSIVSGINRILPEPLFAPFVKHFMAVFKQQEIAVSRQDEWHITNMNGSESKSEYAFFLQKPITTYQLAIENEAAPEEGFQLQMFLEMILPPLGLLTLAPVAARNAEEEAHLIEGCAKSTSQILAIYNDLANDSGQEEEERFEELPLIDDIAIGLEDLE